MTAPTTVDELLAIMARGHDVFDEPAVDGLAHALQCGAILRAERPDDIELAAAGLVHDIADIAFPNDHRAHETVGAGLVAPALGPRVAKLVGAHVAAKRYLVATDPAYRARLSTRSVETLALQGGDLTDDELAAFVADADLDAIVALRRADERAKDPRATPPGLESWRALLEAIAS